jgi:hypothetical protein
MLRLLYAIARMLIRPRLFGLAELAKPAKSAKYAKPAGGCEGGAGLFVANHSGAFGPIMVMSCLPFRVYPWVAFQITEPRTCAAYLDQDFTAGELGLSPFFSRCLARLLCPLCVRLMKKVQAIPVYRNSRRIVHTLEKSREILARGGKLVVFPEKPAPDAPQPVGELDTGFINLARSFYAEQKRALRFYPVAVNKKNRSLTVGAPLLFDPRRPFPEEKRRIKQLLEKRIAELCGEKR